MKLESEVLSDNFDLEKAVAEIPSVSEMTKEERALFESIVEEQAELSGIEDLTVMEDALTDFFDANSETYNDIEASQQDFDNRLQESEDEDIISIYKNDVLQTLAPKKVEAFQVRISVRWVGAILNTAIGFVVGGGVGAIQSFIIKKGKREAKKLFSRTVVSRLKAWGAKKLAVSVGVAVTVALNYLDIGTQIAKQLDKRDKRPNNGYVDIY
ncbi:hypothetical protein [Listeria rocourtiae]|uniref:hypothetical protein n=1 Tax=Listeria rocourtiae TaxID=647910 RepID=UPI003D2F6885